MIYLVLLHALITCTILLESVDAKTDLPNVIFILADDMGYGEIEALNPKRSKIPTPYLNQLASEGRVFTDAHTSSSVCSPTRYSLLTGRYNWRTRLQKGVLTGNDEPLIDENRMTLGHLFQKMGYSTAIFGKWHLNYQYLIPDELKGTPKPKRTKTRYPAKVPVGTQILDGPITRGFDTFYGFHHAREMSSMVRDDTLVEEMNVEEVLPALTREVVSYVDQRAEVANQGKPFFLYFPMSSPHTPIVPAKEWKGRGGLGAYSDFVAQTDGSVGAVMQALKRNGLEENTVVIFTADNGTSKAADIKHLQAQGHYPSAALRGSKADLWDGGHRVPFIVRWPGRVKAGSESSQLICLSDMMATCASFFGVRFDANTAEDSISFQHALLDYQTETPRRSIVHHSIKGKFSIRENEWKLLLTPGSGGWSDPSDQVAMKEGLPEIQLYDLSNDLEETNNLVEQYPEKVEHLVGLLKEMVAQGRSTPGEPQANDVEIDIWK